MDILRDIIADMQEEIEQLKSKQTSIAIWNLTAVPSTEGTLLGNTLFVLFSTDYS